MAKQTVTIDDLDQTPGAREVHFSLDNYEYVIDLNEKNLEQLKTVLAKYIEAATPLGKVYRATPPRPINRRRAALEGPSTAEMREWAKKNGLDVSDRGRLNQEVIDAYLSAH